MQERVIQPGIDGAEDLERWVIERQMLATISPEALLVALAHIRLEKERAIDAEDYDSALTWRDDEKRLLAAIKCQD